jgi:hypothetical protein
MQSITQVRSCSQVSCCCSGKPDTTHNVKMLHVVATVNSCNWPI